VQWYFSYTFNSQDLYSYNGALQSESQTRREVLQKEHLLNTRTCTGRSLIPEPGKKKHLVVMMIEYDLLGADSTGIRVCACLLTYVENISV